MKNKILELLKNSEENFISGERISESLGITRAGIWKYMKLLKEEGYEIESFTKKGYRLLSSPDLLSYEEIKPFLKTEFLGRNLLYFDSLDSTNTKAKELANLNAPNGTVLVSEEQTLGRGRLGRSWVSPKYKGIWTSFILRPNLEPIKIGIVTQIAAAAIHKALLEEGIPSQIKWPNDIVINGKKTCGILIELSCEINFINYVVVGIGINVNLDKEDLPEELLDKATSLKIESEKIISRKRLLASLLNNFEILYKNLIETDSASSSIDICKEASAVIGKEIRIIQGQKVIEARALDINDEGNLIVQYLDGSVKAVFSGEVSVRGKDGYI